MAERLRKSTTDPITQAQDPLEDFLLRPSGHLHPSWLKVFKHADLVARLMNHQAASEQLSQYLLEELGVGEKDDCYDKDQLQEVVPLFLLNESSFERLSWNLGLVLSHEFIASVLQSDLQKSLMAALGRDAYMVALKTAPLLTREWPEACPSLVSLWNRRLSTQDFFNLKHEISAIGKQSLGRIYARYPLGIRARLALKLPYQAHELFLDKQATNCPLDPKAEEDRSRLERIALKLTRRN